MCDAARLANRVQLTSDGHHVYVDAVEDASGLTWTMRCSRRFTVCQPEPETRYSPATCIGCKTAVVTGNPDPDHISTSFVERSNLSMRMGMRRFTRLTNGFSKKLENHGHMVAMYFMHYNFCRVHKTLRITPAMEAGLTDHVWEMEELVEFASENFGVKYKKKGECQWLRMNRPARKLPQTPLRFYVILMRPKQRKAQQAPH